MVDRPTVLTSFSSTETITCLAEGGPNNMFEWSKQGVTVSNSDVLELTMITGSDGGVYVCTVTNDAGSDTATTSVTGMYFINFNLTTVMVHNKDYLKFIIISTIAIHSLNNLTARPSSNIRNAHLITLYLITL